MAIDLHRLALDAAADVLGLEDWVRQALHQPERSLAVQVPYHADDGSTRVVPGYRVAHSTARGPAKWAPGSTRTCPPPRSPASPRS